jgi:hypothetical protein
MAGVNAGAERKLGQYRGRQIMRILDRPTSSCMLPLPRGTRQWANDMSLTTTSAW